MSSTNAKPLPAIIYNPEEKQRETDQFSIHWIEVPKLDVHQDLSQKSQLERWVAFFDNRKLSESERNNLMTDMTINQVYSEIDRFFVSSLSSGKINSQTARRPRERPSCCLVGKGRVLSVRVR